MRHWKMSRTFHMPDELWKSCNGEIRLKNWQAMMENIKLQQWDKAAQHREYVGCFNEKGPV